MLCEATISRVIGHPEVTAAKRNSHSNRARVSEPPSDRQPSQVVKNRVYTHDPGCECNRRFTTATVEVQNLSAEMVIRENGSFSRDGKNEWPAEL